MKKLTLCLVLSVFLLMAMGLAQRAQAVVLGPNLFTNPSFESGTNGAPTGWTKDRWASNTGLFTHPVAGANGTAKAARVTITSFTNGDAKWYPAEAPITAGKTYQFSNYYKSNVETVLVARYRVNGSHTYVYLKSLPVSASFTQNVLEITAPANATAVTIFHVINKVGFLEVDEYALQEVGADVPPPPPPPPSGNIIVNGDAENTDSNGLPVLWIRDRWNNDSAVFDYPVTGVNGSKAVRTTISQKTSGDAKWIPEQVPVTAGKTYTYTDQYISNVNSNILLKYQTAAGPGNYNFQWIKTIPASANFATASHQFTVPAGMEKVTIYHYINDVGFLTLDNATLVEN